MGLTPAEEARKERMARNQAMLASLESTAAELATSAADEANQEAKAKEEAQHRRLEALKEDALQAGRRSSRRNTAAARQRIAAAFRASEGEESEEESSDADSQGAAGLQGESPQTSSEGGEGATGSDEDDMQGASAGDVNPAPAGDVTAAPAVTAPAPIDLSEDTALPEARPDAATAQARKLANAGTCKEAAAASDMTEEDYELQLAMAMSMEAPGDPEQPSTSAAAAATAALAPLQPTHTTPPDAHAPAPSTSGAATSSSPARKAAPAQGGSPGLETKKKPVKRRKVTFKLSDEELQGVFKVLAAGKVTLGIEDVARIVSELDLDVGEDALEAGFELVAQSGFAGTLNRLDSGSFVQFIRSLAT